MNAACGLLLHARLATLEGADCGLLADGALAWRGGRIVWAGPCAALPRAFDDLRDTAIDAGNALVTPGLIDCHTHLVFAGSRADEFERRLQGERYAAIAASGGGIMATVRATRAASEDALLATSLPRARALIADGVTTLEIKSGYGLDLATELAMLRVARRVGETLGITVSTTLLALHALPPEHAHDRGGWVDFACDVLLPAAAGAGLADAVDAFCEGIAFTPAEVRRLFVAARTHRLAVKLHADQLSDTGGAALAAEFGALSADHIEYSDDAGIAAMAAASTVAVLLPGAFYALGETRLPPVAALRARGVAIAVATDLNPGTSPLTSLRLALNLACTLFRLTPSEALRGATVNAARALGLADRGRLAPGLRADLVLWDVESVADLAYWIAGPRARRVIVGGRDLGGHAEP
ncbi:MAG: imidazolonepropionase [Xanthomonadaceae bacterium]|nr:imidazolonepropionase [Xanthomonadaceae bacterium]MDE2177812.1 imidazolonepropionase [Xanthomonadaceae bacterium]MDE2246095.1 imidazolonepropionase [Xanthomonadaceae bacterium]